MQSSLLLALAVLAPLLPSLAAGQRSDSARAAQMPPLAPTPAPAARHTVWVAPTTVGYTVAGAGIATAALMFSEAEIGPVLLLVPAGGLAGAIAGYAIGRRADRALGRAETLSPGHRWAVRSGTVLSGTALGAGLAFVLINPDGPSALGSDETILASSVLGGAALAALIQYAVDDRLWPRTRLRVDVRAPGRRPQLVVGMALRTM